MQVHTPTTSYDDEVEEFYEELTEVREKNKSHYKITMGDFNTKVGWHHQNDGVEVGLYGLGNRKERGTRHV